MRFRKGGTLRYKTANEGLVSSSFGSEALITENNRNNSDIPAGIRILLPTTEAEAIGLTDSHAIL